MPLHEVEAPRTRLNEKAGRAQARGLWRRHGWNLMRFLVAAGIFFLLWQRYQKIEAGLAWRTLAPGWLALSLAMMFGRTVFAVWRWRLLLASSDIHVSLGFLYRLTLESQFVGLVLPGSLSGADMFKVLQLGGNFRKRAETAATLTLARLHGLTSFLFLGAVGALLYWLNGGSSAFVITTGGLLGAALIGDWLLRRRSAWLQKLVLQKLNEMSVFARFFRTFLTSNMDRCLWLKSLLLSLFFQFGIIAVFFLTAKAASIRVNLSQCLFAVPLSSIASLLPLTPSGFGIREGSGAVLFHLAGLPEAAALRLMLLVMVQFLTYIAVGGIFFAVQTGKAQSEEKLDANRESNG